MPFLDKKPLKNYLFATKPLRQISYFTICVCISGIISSFYYYINNTFSVSTLVFHNTFYLICIFTIHHYIENVMRYYLYEDSLYVPMQWIKPKSSNQIILFNNIKRITFKKDTYALVDVNDISYKINPTFNKELIPQIQSVLGNRWHQLYHDGKQLINNQH